MRDAACTRPASLTVVRSLTTDFLFLPDERCLVLLKSGRILMLKGKKITGIVADLSDRLGSHVGDRGLMTVEHHPKFPEVPYLYIGYVYDGTKDEIDSIFAPLAADSPNNDPYYAIGASSGPLPQKAHGV